MADDSILPSHLYVSAAQRQAGQAGAFFYVRHKGDADRGTFMVKLNSLNGQHKLYRQIWDGASRRFECVLEEEGGDAKIEAAIAREADFDPDIWIVEIEDRESRLFFDTIIHGFGAI